MNSMIETQQHDVALSPENVDEMARGQQVRAWLHTAQTATLGTLSTKAGLQGFPMGSIVPYALGADGLPVIYIADIAAHTQNLRADPRVCLFVHDPHAKGDPQAAWRLSLVGRMERLVAESKADAVTTLTGPAAVISDHELAELTARYEERVPRAKAYGRTHAFNLWRMSSVEKVRYIGGFGRIAWLPGEVVKRPAAQGDMAKALSAAVDHMNADHGQHMKEICLGLHGVDAEGVHMVSMDAFGFTLLTKGPVRRLRCSFEREMGADELRSAVVGVLKRALQTGAQSTP